MKTYKITLLKGDGIGPEIVNQAVKVLDAVGKKFGFEAYFSLNEECEFIISNTYNGTVNINNNGKEWSKLIKMCWMLFVSL